MSQKLSIPGIIKLVVLDDGQMELTTIDGFKSIHYSQLDEITKDGDSPFTITYDVE